MSPKCSYCGERYVNPNRDYDYLLGWQEVHCPWWAPAHRKCSDACETAACEELARMYERQTPEGLEIVPASPQGED